MPRSSQEFARKDLFSTLQLFVADMGCMPLADGSVDVVFTSTNPIMAGGTS